jgi:hypothetical protein
MSDDVGAKMERLKSVGLIGDGELDPEYVAVVDSLTADEMEILISVRKRLVAAETHAGIDLASSDMFPP